MVTTFAQALTLALPLFFLALAVLVFAARPAGRVNRVAGAFLLLTGAGDLMWHFMWSSHAAEDTAVYALTGTAFTTMVPFLTLLLVHELYPPVRAEPWRRPALLALFGVSAGLLVAFALDAGVFVSGVGGTPGSRGTLGGWGSPLIEVIAWAAQVVAVLASARVAASPERSHVQRRQAAIVGSSFFVLAVHTGAGAMEAFTRLLSSGDVLTLATVTPPTARALVLAASLSAVPRLWRAFDPPARSWVAALLGGVAVVVLADAAARPVHVLAGEPMPAWWPPLRRILAAISGFLLALAFVRFGLVGLNHATRRRATLVAHASLLALVVMLPVGVVLLVVTDTHWGVATVLLLGLVGGALAPAPFRALRGAASRLLDVDGAGAGAERARLYLDALDRRAAADGRVPPSDDRALADLRAELGLDVDEHARLADLADARRRHVAASDPLLLGRYRVERELGRGAFGTALLALDAATGRRVVLKRYHTGRPRSRALDEAGALSRVRHPRVVPLLAVEHAGDETFLVLEHVTGGTVEDLLRREGPLPPPRALALVRDALEGLDAMHSAGLAHGDVKASNLFVDADGRAVVGDLGASRVQEARGVDATLTASPVIGSFATVAPEVLRGKRPSPAGDVYATGAVLYRLVTGEDYVELTGRTPVDLMRAVLHDPPRLPHPRMPAPVGHVVARALQKLPDARYATAAEMLAALDAAGITVDGT